MPPWLHDVLHSIDGSGSGGISPGVMIVMMTSVLGFVLLYTMRLFMDKMSREAPLLEKLAKLDKELTQVKNESAVIKR